MVDEETDDQRVQVHNLLAQLREGSEYLENQKEALSRLWKGIEGKVVTFYETEPTESVKKVCGYHTDHTGLSCIFPLLCVTVTADINSWRPDRSSGKVKKWCNDSPPSFIYQGNLAIRSTLTTQIW